MGAKWTSLPLDLKRHLAHLMNDKMLIMIVLKRLTQMLHGLTDMFHPGTVYLHIRQTGC